MALENDIRDMARLPIFQEIEQDALRLLAFSAETKILRKGDVLFRRGDASDSGYFVLSGSFQIESPHQRESAEFVIQPYSLIGEMALLTGTERPATVTAREPSTVLKITRAVFHRVLQEHPKSAIRVRASLEGRLARFTGGLTMDPSLLA
ncbi:MAG: cyclic nucleotide-binding protein [Hyphomicrobiales bacterium]|jgi:CRP-like cAMP-binding protein|nr:cyclic nucleotide-binding protein [Hyphomicrobiales bacterium]